MEQQEYIKPGMPYLKSTHYTSLTIDPLADIYKSNKPLLYDQKSNALGIHSTIENESNRVRQVG